MKRIAAFFLCLFLILSFQTATAEPAVKVSRGNPQLMLDGKITTYWEFKEGSTATFKPPAEKSYLLLRFKKEGCSFEYSAFDANGDTLTEETAATDKIEYCLSIPENCAELKLTFTCSNAICRADFSENFDHAWLDAPEQTDILLISAHQDDEVIFMGGLIPLFADSGKTVTVAYTAGTNRTRIDEALEGLWRVGIKHYPDFLRFADYKRSPQELEEIWGGHESILGRFVELIRKRKPQIIVTHDIKGEYGHGAHIYTSSLVREAVKLAADESAYPESAEAYGTWETKKLYIHLYKDNSIRLNYAKTLETFGEKTAAEVAMHGYMAHVSQRKGQDGRFRKAISGTRYDSSLFGLYYSTVGYDTKGFFCSIDETYDSSLTADAHCWSVNLPLRPDEIQTATPTASPSATPTATPTASSSPLVPTPTQSQTPTGAPPTPTVSMTPLKESPSPSVSPSSSMPPLTEQPSLSAEPSQPSEEQQTEASLWIPIIIIAGTAITVILLGCAVKKKGRKK